MEWKPCTVLGYSDKTRRYKIRWDSNDEKFVGRFNIILQGEDQPLFKQGKQLLEEGAMLPKQRPDTSHCPGP